MVHLQTKTIIKIIHSQVRRYMTKPNKLSTQSTAKYLYPFYQPYRQLIASPRGTSYI